MARNTMSSKAHGLLRLPRLQIKACMSKQEQLLPDLQAQLLPTCHLSKWHAMMQNKTRNGWPCQS